MNPIYGTIVGYSPYAGGFVIFISFALTPGGSYDQQLSTDGGASWITIGSMTIPPTLPEPAARWNTSLQVPGGLPTRLLPK